MTRFVYRLYLAACVGVIVWACAGCGSAATVARKAVIGVDTANGAAARMARAWVRKCGQDAKALLVAGKADESDAKYTECEQTGDRLVQVLVGLEDGAQAASDTIDVGEALGRKDFSAALAPLYALARDLAKVFADAGIQLPKIPGVTQ